MKVNLKGVATTCADRIERFVSRLLKRAPWTKWLYVGLQCLLMIAAMGCGVLYLEGVHEGGAQEVSRLWGVGLALFSFCLLGIFVVACAEDKKEPSFAPRDARARYRARHEKEQIRYYRWGMTVAMFVVSLVMYVGSFSHQSAESAHHAELFRGMWACFFWFFALQLAREWYQWCADQRTYECRYR